MIVATRSDYTRMSVGEKQAHHRDQMREPPIACPLCETQTTVADLVQHVEARCPEARSPGRREPHPRSKWIGYREALVLGGVPKATLSRWVKLGRVRVRSPGDRRQYLLRDLVRLRALSVVAIRPRRKR